MSDNANQPNVIHLPSPPPADPEQVKNVARGLLRPSLELAQRIAIDWCKDRGLRVP